MRWKQARAAALAPVLCWGASEAPAAAAQSLKELVFSASNLPDLVNFPQGVTFQRNADFVTKVLRNVANTANVSVSIDPFFFKLTEP